MIFERIWFRGLIADIYIYFFNGTLIFIFLNQFNIIMLFSSIPA